MKDLLNLNFNLAGIKLIFLMLKVKLVKIASKNNLQNSA